jgi:hypothetical protein
METMLICTTSGFFSVGTENSQCTSATHGPRRGSRIVRIPRRPALDQRDRDPGQGFHRRQCAGGLDRSGSTGAGTVGACAAPAGLAFKRRKGRRIGTSVRGDPALRTGDDGSVTGEGICPSAAAARSLLRFDLTRTAVLLRMQMDADVREVCLSVSVKTAKRHHGPAVYFIRTHGQRPLSLPGPSVQRKKNKEERNSSISNSPSPSIGHGGTPFATAGPAPRSSPLACAQLVAALRPPHSSAPPSASPLPQVGAHRRF